MGAAENRAKSAKMASDMKAKGIYHGKRTTSPMHANYPKPGEVGSAAYRRLTKRKPSSAS